MAYRTVKTVHGDAQCWARVQWSPELEEFRVRFYRHAERMEEADYFTDDRADAMGTARAEVARMEGQV